MLVKHALTVFGRHWPLLDVNVVARQVMTFLTDRGQERALQQLTDPNTRYSVIYDGAIYV